MKTEVKQTLQKVLALSDEMIALAASGTQAGGGVDCGIIFGTLRDAGYKLRQLCARELQRDDKSGRQVESGTAEVGEGRAEKGSDTTAVAPDPTRKSVLIVDDEPDVVTYLSRWFEDRGFATLTAQNGIEAMERAAKDRPDLITLDMSMPERSGVKVFKQLKETADLDQIPVIIITALGSPMKKFLDKTNQVPSPEGFIAKPIDLSDLAAQVKRLVG
jgi:CheY-like chemotaxis protein